MHLEWKDDESAQAAGRSRLSRTADQACCRPTGHGRRVPRYTRRGGDSVCSAGRTIPDPLSMLNHRNGPPKSGSGRVERVGSSRKRQKRACFRQGPVEPAIGTPPRLPPTLCVVGFTTCQSVGYDCCGHTRRWHDLGAAGPVNPAHDVDCATRRQPAGQLGSRLL